jgi:hypothetical protein
MFFNNLKGIIMARVIVNGESLPVTVAFVGNNLQIWIVADVYTLLVEDKSIKITEEEADGLAADIENLSPQDLEAKWFAVAKEFLSSLE